MTGHGLRAAPSPLPLSAGIATESATRNPVLSISHDQHGSTVSVTGLDGRLSDTYEYADFGRTLRSKVYADVSKAEITAVAADTPEGGVTQITLSTTFTTDELAGRELFVGGTSAAGHVLANTGSVIYVRDPADAIATSLWSGGALRGFAVLDFVSVRRRTY